MNSRQRLLVLLCWRVTCWGEPTDLEVGCTKSPRPHGLPTRITPHWDDQINVVALSADDRVTGHIGEVNEVGSGRYSLPGERLVNGFDYFDVLCSRLGGLDSSH